MTLVLQALLLSLPLSLLAAPIQDHPKISPFSALRWTDDGVEVQVDDTWYELRAIDGIETEKILRAARDRYGRLWQKRFGEDLPQVLAEMGHEPDRHVSLHLRRLTDGERVELERVEMTEANRQRIWSANNARPDETTGLRLDDDHFPKLSPFTGVRWPGEGVEIRVESEWYRLLKLDDVSTEELLEFTKQRYGRLWQKRFSEDLAEILIARRALPADRRVDLELRALDDERRIVLRDVRMTEENRRAVLELNHELEEPVPRDVRRVERRHSRGTRELRWLVEPLPVREGSRRLRAGEIAADLDQLEWEIEHLHSYRDLRGLDYRSGLDTIRQHASDGLQRNELALAVARLLGAFGDGHTRLDESFDRILPEGYLPFLLGDAEGGIVAFEADRSRLIDPDRPYVLRIDGLPIERWIEAGETLGRKGSGAFEARRALRAVRYLGYCRRILSVPADGEVALELGAPGQEPRQVTRLLVERRPIYGSWPRGARTPLPREIGYVRIDSMSSESQVVDHLRSLVPREAKARGLILDLRENGGGSRDILRALFPSFLPEGAVPRVVNVGAFRIPPGIPTDAREGYLGDRFLFPVTASVWTDAERDVIERFARGFRPEWKPPRGDFSEWHYLVLSPSERESLDDVPVVILMDTGCFSATDIFLGAFAELPQVTRIGTPSSGGSGRSRSRRLAHSGIDYRLSSMVSFRPTGATYDGNGIQPDILVKPAPEDFVHGESDRQLAAAIEHLMR